MNTVDSKIHLRLGSHDRALCGMNPHRGSHDVFVASAFFMLDESQQCLRCLIHYSQHGYSVKKARAQGLSDRMASAQARPYRPQRSEDGEGAPAP